MSVRLRGCPMCGATVRRPYVSLEKPSGRFEICECRACSFRYVPEVRNNPARDAAASDRDAPPKPRHHHIKTLLERESSGRGGTDPVLVVEVGAGWGRLARLLRDDRRFRYVGFEPNPERARYLNTQGIECHPEPFSGARLGRRADVVVIDNVLEHVLHPRDLVAEVAANLSSPGMLVVIVPNVCDVRRIRRSWRHNKHWQTPHINYFSAQSLRALYKEHGMRMRFFDPGLVGAAGGRLLLLRPILDQAGLHLFGLNTYAIAGREV